MSTIAARNAARLNSMNDMRKKLSSCLDEPHVPDECVLPLGLKEARVGLEGQLRTTTASSPTVCSTVYSLVRNVGSIQPRKREESFMSDA